MLWESFFDLCMIFKILCQWTKPEMSDGVQPVTIKQFWDRASLILISSGLANFEGGPVRSVHGTWGGDGANN